MQLRAIERKRVNLRKLKNFAFTLPQSFVFRDIILSENDEMDTKEFVQKLKMWCVILNHDLKKVS